jgi:Protein of unknown function (DUF1469).
MEDKTLQVESLIEKTQQLGMTNLELLKLKGVDKASEAISSIASIWAVVVPVVFSFILLSIGLAIWIGDAMGKTYLGFLMVGAFFALVAVTIFICRMRWIKRPLRNLIIRQLLKKTST